MPRPSSAKGTSVVLPQAGDLMQLQLEVGSPVIGAPRLRAQHSAYAEQFSCSPFEQEACWEWKVGPRCVLPRLMESWGHQPLERGEQGRGFPSVHKQAAPQAPVAGALWLRIPRKRLWHTVVLHAIWCTQELTQPWREQRIMKAIHGEECPGT